jgi:TctA family transporter
MLFICGPMISAISSVFLCTLAAPELFKISTNVVSHDCYVALQMVGVTVTQQCSQRILRPLADPWSHSPTKTV